MASTNNGHVFEIAHEDVLRSVSLNVKDLSAADARRLMSEEHKALGYRPPANSLAAQVQAAVARHGNAHLSADAVTVDEEKLRLAAKVDAERIKQERETCEQRVVDLNFIGEAEARKLMSDEHKTLGYRPPPSSLAAEAQAAAAKHPGAMLGLGSAALTQAALTDASFISAPTSVTFDVDSLGADEAKMLMSEEHRALGYRPPHGSLAATAQAAASKHPDAHAGIDVTILSQAAMRDAKRIETTRASRSSISSGSVSSSPSSTRAERASSASMSSNSISEDYATSSSSEQGTTLAEPLQFATIASHEGRAL